MGYYTEFHFNADLRCSEYIPKVICILEYMLQMNKGAEPDYLPDHPFFKTRLWKEMLLGDSSMFPGKTHSTLDLDDYTKTYSLNIRCNFKNYNDEIYHFLNWINPYINAVPGDFLGFSRGEDSQEPIIIRKQ